MHFYFRDVNRDGDADIIAGHGTGTVWLGDGRGGFTPANNGLPSSSYGLGGIGVGDADNDGGCDISYVTSSGGVEVRIWDEAAQTWQNFSGSLPIADSFYATQLCDMNADGFMDLVALRRGYLQVWTGDGAGNWTPAAQMFIGRPNGYSAMRVGADFDHNGRPDVAVITREGSWPNDHNIAHAFRETSPRDTLGIFPVFPGGGERFQDGSVQFLDWWSKAPGFDSTRVRIELSTSGSNGPWESVADTLRNAGRFQWFIPQGIVSGDCYLRYTVSGPAGSVQAVTPRAFGIGTAVGVADHRPAPQGKIAAPTIVRGVLFSPPPAFTLYSSLFSLSGQKVLVLRPGPNDVSRLAPGVYFVQARTQARVIRKVVVAR
jgi:hypothetical protein